MVVLSLQNSATAVRVSYPSSPSVVFSARVSTAVSPDSPEFVSPVLGAVGLFALCPVSHEELLIFQAVYRFYLL